MYLTSLPAKVIATSEAVFVIRGLTKIKFPNQKLHKPLDKLIAYLAGRSIAEKELLAQFDKTFHGELIQVIAILVSNKIISYVKKRASLQVNLKNKAEDIFYWHFQKKSKDVRKNIGNIKLAIAGINEFSISLMRMLRRVGFSKCYLISDAVLNEHALSYRIKEQGDIRKNLDCIIAIAPLNQKQSLINWGEAAAFSTVHFYPILINNLRAYLGPYISPGQAPCYNCVVQRMGSNIEPYYPQSIDCMVEDSFFSKDIHGYHPCMISAVASYASMELVNQVSNLTAPTHNSITDLCLINQQAFSSKVLKSPGCLVCKGK